MLFVGRLSFVQIMLLQVSPVEVTSISFSVLQERKKETSERNKNKKKNQSPTVLRFRIS